MYPAYIFFWMLVINRGSTKRRMPTHTTAYQRIPGYTNACHPMQLYFGYLYVTWGGGGGGCHLRVVPLGNFIEGQAHPNVFAFLQFSSNRGFSIFCVVKFFLICFCVCFPVVQGFSPMLLCFFSNSFQFKFFIYSLYIHIYIFLYIFSLYSGFFHLCWVISLGCRPRIDRPAHTLYIYRIV